MKVHYMSKSYEWETPKELFDILDKEFSFDLDPCASYENAKCTRFYTKEDDGLKQSWKGFRVFMNPPYGREIADWVQKAYEESMSGAEIVVGLLPARTDTHWFHNYVYPFCTLRFLKGRLKFSNSKKDAPFPSMIAIWNKRYEGWKQ